MYKLTINEEFNETGEVVDCVNQIANMVKEGYTSGYNPTWSLEKTEEEKVDHVHDFYWEGATTESGEHIEHCAFCDATRDSSGNIIE